ncbi:MAG: hypothetical protein SPI35_05870 [Porphyromonas sp.]|nr:hypothetical protein [Porphyromonas sp.]
MEKFELYTEGGKQFISHNEFPRLRGEVTFSTGSDITNIEMVDFCTDPQVLAQVMQEAGVFLLSKSKK